MKKLLALLCVLCCFALPAWTVLAAPAESTPPTIIVFMEEQSDVALSSIDPRLGYLVSAGTDVQIVNGRAQCQGNYTTAGTRRIRITMTLQYSTVNTADDAYWSDVQTWVKSWNTAGTHVLEKPLDLSVRGYYRVYTTISVLDDNQQILEAVVLISLNRQY